VVSFIVTEIVSEWAKGSTVTKLVAVEPFK